MRAKKRSGGKKQAPHPLYDAIWRGDLEQVRAIYSGEPELLYSKDEEGRTPLHLAAYHGRLVIMEFLLSRNRKPDINARANDGGTPLYHAVGGGHCDTAELLLENNADVNAQNDEGWSPFRLAAFKVDWDLVNLLLKHGGQK